MAVPEDIKRHTLHVSDDDVSALDRALRTRHRMIALMSDARLPESLVIESEMLAHVAALVQIHLHCDCPQFGIVQTEASEHDFR